MGNWGPQRCFCWGWEILTGSGQGDREPTAACQPSACSEYHERVRSQGQQLQQLQAELVKLHKEMSSVRAANSEVSPADAAQLSEPGPGVWPLGAWPRVSRAAVHSPPTLEPHAPSALSPKARSRSLRTPPQYKTCPQAPPLQAPPSLFQRVAQLVFQRLSEDFVRKPDYALSSVARPRERLRLRDVDRTMHKIGPDRPTRRTLPRCGSGLGAPD